MSDRVKIALIGCGGMGRRHLRGIARLAASTHANLELVALCDLNAENAEFAADEAAELMGKRPRVYTDLARMLREVTDLQAVSITTDASSHQKVAPLCFEAGLHVMSEKPLGLTVRACTFIIEAARRAGRILSVAENYRRDPINRLGRALVQDGAIGNPRLMLDSSVSGRNRIAITPWRHMKLTGTITVDAGVHNADILRFYMGEARTIYGETRLHEKTRVNTGSAGPGGFYGRWAPNFPDQIEPTGEDAMYAHITFESGAVGQWTYDQAGHGLPLRSRHVYGSTGSLELPGDRNGRPIKLHLDDGTVIDDDRILDYAPSYRLSPLAAELFGGERVWTYKLDFNETDSRILALEYHELGHCASTGQRPEVTGEEARADVAFTYAPFESGQLGRPVTMAEMVDASADVYQREIDEHLGLLQAPPIPAS
ncbi:MAG: Gfo/Idh/MocA family oxidoreductase [Chloroflexota bacterium]